MGDSAVRRPFLMGILDEDDSLGALVEGEPKGLSTGICDELRFGIMGCCPRM